MQIPSAGFGVPVWRIMVFALPDDFVNLENLHIQHDDKNPCHPLAAATDPYHRTLPLT